MDLFTPEYLNALLGPAEQAKLTKILFITAIVWWTMRGKVQKVKDEIKHYVDEALLAFTTHTKGMEEQLKKGVEQIESLKEAVAKDLKLHKERLELVETRVGTLEKGK